MKNRRATPRLAATETRIWLGFWTGPDRFESLAARVENIGLGGARVVAATPPAPGQSVWLRAGTPVCTDCVQGSVLDVERHGPGGFGIRVAFDMPCPPRLLRTIACGGVPHPHFRHRSARPADDRELASPGELTGRPQSPIIPRLSSKSRTTV